MHGYEAAWDAFLDISFDEPSARRNSDATRIIRYDANYKKERFAELLKLSEAAIQKQAG